MKVKLSKDHGVLGSKGDVVEVTEDQANYLKRVGVAKSHKEEKENSDTKEEKSANSRKTKEEKSIRKTK